MKKTNLCGIFATLFVATTIVLLASCSQDDDYYESDMYTLAERGTRLGGGDPGGVGETQTIQTCSLTLREVEFNALNPPEDYVYTKDNCNVIIRVTYDPATQNNQSDIAYISHSCFYLQDMKVIGKEVKKAPYFNRVSVKVQFQAIRVELNDSINDTIIYQSVVEQVNIPLDANGNFKR